MRILQVVENLELGGLERMALDLALQEKAAGHVPLLYCLFDPGKLADDAQDQGIPVTAFHKKPGFSLATVAAMAAAMRRDRPEVVHTHNPGVHHYAALAAWIARVPAVVNTRHSALTSKGIPYQDRYFRWVQPLTGQTVYVADFVRRALAEQHAALATKTRVIVNGIPTAPFRAHPADPGAHRPRMRFGTVGRLVPAKAHGVLIDAFAKVAAELPDAELTIFGGGALAEELSRQVQRLQLGRRVRLAGPTADTPSALAGLDIFVMSSITEGLPLVILEAMAAGLPIVSTRVGGISDVAPEGEIAWFCEPGDADSLANAMLAAAHAGDLRERGRRAASLAADRYDVTIMFREYERLFLELLQGRQS